MKRSNLIIAILSIVIFATVGFGQETSETDTAAATNAESTVPAKPEGTLRIGLVMPRLQIGAEASSAEAAGAIRDAMSAYLKGPTVDVVVIEAKSPTNAAMEATQKGCDFILYTGVSKKTKTSIFGSLIKAAVPVVAGHLPEADPAAETASGLTEAKRAGAAGGKEYVNNAIAAKFGAKDEITFEFSLARADAKSVAAKGSSAAKVKADGEDIMTVLIEQVSEKVLQAVVKK